MITGLTDAEAAERLWRDGVNELPSARPRHLSALAIEGVRDPIFLLLAAGGTIYLMLGDVQEALMLLGFVFLIVGITFYQERKTERALEVLRDLSSPRALVIRHDRPQRIAGREVVRDDIIVLRDGDRVPADAVLVHGTNLAPGVGSLLWCEPLKTLRRPMLGRTPPPQHYPGGSSGPVGRRGP